MATQLYDIIGQPFGRGTTDATITSNPSTATKCTGTISTTTLNVASVTGFSANDLVLIHQTYNISDGNRTAANLEANEIGSVGGSSFTLKNNLDRTYTSLSQQGGDVVGGAQVIKVAEYNDLTIGALNVGGFGRQTNPRGGLMAVAVKNALSFSGKLNMDGQSGYFSDQDHSGKSELEYWDYWGTRASGGFSGGWNTTDGSPSSAGGNYIFGQQPKENDDDRFGDGGAGTYQTASGGGGGNGTVGSPATDGAEGGFSCGNAALTSFMLGGGGGGQAGGGGGGDPKWTGASGGGGCFIWARDVQVSGGTIEADGGTGISNIDAGGGGGSGGSIQINCQTGTFGSSLVHANAGSAFGKAGAGGVGRIRINYGAQITGTTSPTASTAQDPKLTVAQGAFIMNMI